MHCPSWSALKRRRIYYHISAKWLEQFHFQEVRISISRLNFKIQNRKVVSWEIAPLKCKCNVVPKNFNHGSAREWQATLHVSQQQKNVCRNAAIKIRIVQDFSTWHKQIKLHFSYFKKPQRYAIQAGTSGQWQFESRPTVNFKIIVFIYSIRFPLNLSMGNEDMRIGQNCFSKQVLVVQETHKELLPIYMWLHDSTYR